MSEGVEGQSPGIVLVVELTEIDMGISFHDFVGILRIGGKVACFGSRQTPPNVLSLMEELGAFIAQNGGLVASGHAQGADQAFERGASSVDPTRVLVCLPWRGYERNVPISPGAGVSVLTELPKTHRENLLAMAKQHHGAWHRLSRGGKLLQGCNMLIGELAQFGLCYLNHDRPGKGGSGQCWRYLRSCGVPVVDFAVPGVVDTWRAFLNEA